MNRLHLAAMAAAVVLAAAALTACGGSDDSSADEDDITAAIDKAATSGDPAACTDVQTANFNTQTAGGTAEQALKDCEQDAANTAGDSVETTNIEVDGEAATADVAFTGGQLGGQTLDIALVKDGDQWKLDKLNGFVEFDQAALAASFVAQLEQAPDIPPATVACFKQQLESGAEDQVQALVLDPSSGEDLFAPCG